MQIDVINGIPGISDSFFSECINQVVDGEHKTAESVSIIFLPKDDLRLLKKEYFGLDVYTDVISFNLNEPDESLEGEIYLSYEQIQENAKIYKTESIDELRRVVIHGCLHLVGYEDATQDEKEKMTTLENYYINKTLNSGK